MRFSSASGMRAADQEAIISRGIPSLELMETAAGRLTDAAQKLLGGLHGKKAVVFSGSGNNGGDGLAAARLMKQRGALVSVWMTGNAERLTHDTAHMLRKARECSAEVREFEQEAAGRDCSDAHIILDAMFGIGLNSPIRGVGVEAVGIINDSPAKVIAVDIASGVEADTGRILGRAVRADMTVAFSCAKPGHVIEPGCACAGELIIADIGIPEDIVKSALLEMDLVTGRYVKEHLPQRLPISHKGNYGRILVIAGSRGYTGAPSLAANAASRAGAGLVFVGVPACIYPIVAQKCSETMPFPLPDDSAGSTWQRGALTLEALEPLLERLGAAQVCLIGPGLGRAPETAGLVLELISRSERTIVLDADGINALQGHIDLLKRARCPIILTPHEGEFLRLGGDIKKLGRLGSAQRFALEYGCTLVLKGHRTIIAGAAGAALVNTTGNAGMAKGGSGDVLSGVIAALLGQGSGPFDAAAMGVWIHGAAGDAAARKYGMYSMSPMDTTSALADIFKTL